MRISVRSPPPALGSGPGLVYLQSAPGGKAPSAPECPEISAIPGRQNPALAVPGVPSPALAQNPSEIVWRLRSESIL